MFNDRRNIGCTKGLVFSKRNDKGRTFTNTIQLVRSVVEQDHKSKGAAATPEQLAKCLEGIAIIETCK